MNEFVRFVLDTGTVAKIVLIILSILSVVSWAIVFEKAGYFIKMGRESKRFLFFFSERVGWDRLYNTSRSFKHSPYAHLFRKVYSELHARKRQPHAEEGGLQEIHPNPGNPYQTSLSQIMESTITESLSKADNRLVFLSITISVSPFLGLFGTVWGVMGAFMSIGMKGSADISTVGPGIAEALITTVVGLAVAIPALAAYNVFISRLRKLEDRLGVFSTELLRLFEREKSA